MSCFDASIFHARNAGEVRDWDAIKIFPTPPQAPRSLRAIRSRRRAARVRRLEASVESRVSRRAARRELRHRAWRHLECGIRAHALFEKRGPRGVNQTLAVQVFGGSAHSNIAIECGFRGVGTTNSNSCASGAVAVGEALRYIRDGWADVMIAGGAEAPLSPLTFGAFDFIRTMSRWQGDPAAFACRPFDKNRDGFVMGEGACSLGIGEHDHAVRRGACIYAEVLGYAMNNDAFHMTSPAPDGECVTACMTAALAVAALAAGTSSASAAPAAPSKIIAFSKPFDKLSPDDTADLVADVGWDGIECAVRAKSGHIAPERVEKDLPKMVEALKKRGKTIEIVTTEIVKLDPLAEKILRMQTRIFSGTRRCRITVHFSPMRSSRRTCSHRADPRPRGRAPVEREPARVRRDAQGAARLREPRRRDRRASSRDVVRVEKFPGMEPPSRRRRYARPRRARRLHGENHKCHASDHEGCACEFRDRRRALQLQRRPGRQRDRSARRSDKPEDRQIFFRRSSSSSIRRPASSASRSATMHRRTISPHTRRC